MNKLNFRKCFKYTLILTSVLFIAIGSSCKPKIKENTLIPNKVYAVRDYVRQYNKPPKGYVGGRIFKNLEKKLPRKNVMGTAIKYKEWDVNKKIKGKNRGKERLVTGNDNIDYYTADHYNTFIIVPKTKQASK